MVCPGTGINQRESSYFAESLRLESTGDMNTGPERKTKVVLTDTTHQGDTNSQFLN